MSDSARSIVVLDPDLAAALPAEQRAAVLQDATVRTRKLERGEWDAFEEYGARASWTGLLVVDGFLARRTTCAGESVSEIVGPGDLLRPWDHDDEYPIEGIGTSWRLLDATTIALLDDVFAERVAAWPPLTVAILARIGRRARWLGLRLLVSQIHGVEIRVLYLLWHLWERWGERVDGVLRVPVPLTHEQIGELIGAQRPSVSNAVSRLREEGVRQIQGSGWEIPPSVPDTIDRMLGPAARKGIPTSPGGEK